MTITATQVAYYGLNLAGGAVALPILLLTTALSRNVKKQPVLINMYIACIYEAMLACLLFFANCYPLRMGDRVITRIQSGSPLCLVQAILFMPGDALVGGAVMAIVLHIFLLIRSIRGSATVGSGRPSYFILIFPYVSYIVVAVPIIVIAIRHPSRVSPHQLYCSLDDHFAQLLVAVIPGGMTLISVILQVWTLILLKRHHDHILTRSALDISLIFRASLFAFYLLFAVGASMATATDFTAVVLDMYGSTVPLVVSIIFGSQRDLLRTWQALITTHPVTTIKEWMTSPAMSGSPHENSTAMQMRSFDRGDSYTSRTTQVPWGRQVYSDGILAPHTEFLKFAEASRVPGAKRVEFSHGGIGNTTPVRPPGVVGAESYDVGVYVAELDRQEQRPPKSEWLSGVTLDIRQDHKLPSFDVESVDFESKGAGGEDRELERGDQNNNEGFIVTVSPVPNQTISVDFATSQQYSTTGSLGHGTGHTR